MALPVVQAVGTADAAMSTISPAWPAHLAGDIALLFVETSNQATATTLSDAQGFVEVTDSPQGAGGGAGTSGECRLAVFWCRATSNAMSAPTVVDVGNHQYGVIVTFRGCIASGDPWDVTAGDIDDVGSTSVSIPGDTTTVADCLIVAACARGIDDAAAKFTDWANADLANVAEIFDEGTALGHGGGLGIATGEKAAAGAFGATTATLANSSMQGRIMIALKPPTPGGGAAPPETWYYRTTAQGAHFG